MKISIMEEENLQKVSLIWGSIGICAVRWSWELCWR